MNDDEKKTFVMYASWRPAIQKMSMVQRGKFLTAVYELNSGVDPVIDDPVVDAVFAIARERFEADASKYQEKCRKNAENRRKYLNDRQRSLRTDNGGQRSGSDTDTGTDTDTDTDTGTDTDTEKEINKNNRGLSKDKPCRPLADDRVPYSEIRELFNSTCTSLPHILSLSESRKRVLRSLYKRIGMDGIRELFQKAEASDFLSGRSGDWQASFDWLIKAGNSQKVLEGNYDRQKHQPQSRLAAADSILDAIARGEA